MVSLPQLPSMESLSAPPSMVLWWSPPAMVSFPAPPEIESLPPPPFSESAFALLSPLPGHVSAPVVPVHTAVAFPSPLACLVAP